jgi:hypothetical protein
MEGREERDPGYDDWFDEPEPPTETQSGAGRAVHDGGDDEVWVLPEEESPRAGHRREFVVAGRTLTTTQVAIIAGPSGPLPRDPRRCRSLQQQQARRAAGGRRRPRRRRSPPP